MISVTMIGAETYRVEIDGSVDVRVDAKMSSGCYLSLSGGKVTHEWTIVQVCRELLSRERADLIESDFDIDSLVKTHDWISEGVTERLAQSS